MTVRAPVARAGEPADGDRPGQRDPARAVSGRCRNPRLAVLAGSEGLKRFTLPFTLPIAETHLSLRW